MKWFLWHGNVVRALESVGELEDLVAAREPTDDNSKLEKAVEEFHTYIQNNTDLIPNYGERRRNGEKNLDGHGRVDRQSRNQQTHGEEPADEMEPARSASAAASAHARTEW
jgi:hypothetical protein